MWVGPYHLAEGREEEKLSGKCGRFGGWSGGGEAWPSHLEAQPGVWEVCGPPRAPAPCICVGRGPVVPLRTTHVVDSDVLTVMGRGPGFLAQPLSIEQATQAGCPPSSHSGHGGGSGWRDITGSETADLSQRPFH